MHQHISVCSPEADPAHIALSVIKRYVRSDSSWTESTQCKSGHSQPFCLLQGRPFLQPFCLLRNSPFPRHSACCKRGHFQLPCLLQKGPFPAVPVAAGLEEVPDGITKLSRLQHLSLNSCSKMTCLTDKLSGLKSLSELSLNDTSDCVLLLDSLVNLELDKLSLR